MFLSDRDIRARLGDISFATDDDDHPFDAADQIQPCSVDLRLDNVFWRQTSRRAIDLRRSKLLELSPRRHWTKISLDVGESVSLRPGEMLLGRTFESFTVPGNLAGKLEGRSSFARMGLAVHCSADFINPGYRGKMPLELINLGKSTIRLFPRVPICQVMFIQLSSDPERVYGARELSSKYMNDDGGPSYWWRDKRIRQLQRTLGEHDVAEAMQRDILELLAPSDPDLIDRFERTVRKARKDELSNSSELLEKFARQEDWSRLRARVLKALHVGVAPFMLAVTAGSFFAQPFGWLHYVAWTLTVGSIPLSVAGLRRDTGEFFGKRELQRLQAKETLPALPSAKPQGSEQP